MTTIDFRQQTNPDWLISWAAYPRDAFVRPCGRRPKMEPAYDWSSDQWTVPINASVSKVVNFGDQPVSFQLGGWQYIEGPEGRADWGIRFGVTFLFPR